MNDSVVRPLAVAVVIALGAAACSGKYQTAATDGGADATSGDDASAGDDASGGDDASAVDAHDTGACSQCTTPGCCGTSCQVTHSNGVGQSFYDCTPLNTYALSQANEACKAFTNDIAECTEVQCSGDDGGINGHAVCSFGSPTSCVCWTFDGTELGFLHNGQAPGQANCGCPAPPGDTTRWN